MFLVIIFFTFDITYATDTNIEIENFLDTISQYSNELIPELEDTNILENVIGGEGLDGGSLINRILNFFFKELRIAIRISN